MSRILLSGLFVLCAIAAGAVQLSAQEGSPKSIRGGILNGKATSLPKPVYPEAAKAAKVEGTVVVDVVVNEEGNVESAVASSQPEKLGKPGGDPEKAEEIQPADPILREAAEKAALQAKFAPTLLSGQPVKIVGKIVYRFALADEQQFSVVTTNSPPVGLKAINAGIINGKAVKLPKPEYPPAAHAVNASGAVSVQVVVDESGNVIHASAVSGHPLLRAAAVKAARGAEFSPTRLEGQPVKIRGIIVYNFVP